MQDKGHQTTTLQVRETVYSCNIESLDVVTMPYQVEYVVLAK